MSKNVSGSGVHRCTWATKPVFWDYHDKEWGTPVHNDLVHFEFLVLEAAQAGLSWETILKRREGYRKAFANFDPLKVARFTEANAAKLLLNPGIIRNRLKIKAAIQNAKRFLEVQKEFGSFDAYLWSFTKGKVLRHSPTSIKDIPATTELSDRVSKDLKKRGFTFVGSTVMYAHLQAVGIVNDHERSCFRYKKLTHQ
jgi:DNA-3-methyladenine glycosylase I